MEASALLNDIEKNLDDVCEKTIFTGMLPAEEYRYRYLVQKIQAKIGRSVLNHHLRAVWTHVKDLVDTSAKGSSRNTDPGTYFETRATNTDKMKKVLEELERVAHKAEKLVGESERTLGLGEVGREKETEEIIDQLMYFCGSSNPVTGVPVIIITGLAGIGKTILATLVCDHNKVKHNHKVGMPVWVSNISHDTFDPSMIAKLLIDIYSETPQTGNSNVFVILDDLGVEIEDKHLEVLQSELKVVARPLHVTAIMITTRSSRVVRDIAASPVYVYVLPGLNEEESLCLFKTILGLIPGDKSVFVSRMAEDVTRKIVGQCRGVPLAIVIMAKLLFYSRPSPSRLTKFMRQDFLHELSSFYYKEFQIEELPHKLCFTYCSVFPQGYLIDAERLIHLWMAEGFVDSSNPSTSSESDREAIGRGYLRDLVDRSIFQDIKEDELGTVRSCRLHPLMHDIASFNVDLPLRASFDLSMDFSPETLFAEPKELRSMFFFAGSRLPLQVEVEMSKAMLENIFKRFKRLCVLDLRGLRIKIVPRSIGKLSKLVYLDLSQNDMKKLPNSITNLSNLQTLKLSRCYSLQELPNKFEKLTKLEHLDLEGCVGLTRMPRNMSKLSSLRTLSSFVVSKNDPSGGLQQLTKLSSGGHLEILHMEGMGDFENFDHFRQNFPYGVTFENILYLERLTLRWDLGVHHQHLCFTLPFSLRVLIFVGYKSYMPLNFSHSLQFLVKLSLYDCHGFKFVFDSSWEFPNLEILELLRLDNVEFIAHDNFETYPTFCSRLNEFIISDCPKLQGWWRTPRMENEMPFHSISKLHVHHCPRLAFIPPYADLVQELVLVGCSLELLFSSINHGNGSDMSKLRSMVVSSVTERWPQDFDVPPAIRRTENSNHVDNLSACFKHMSSLQRLTIENCADMNLDGKSNQWEGLNSLRFLTVRTIPILNILSFSDSVTSLRELTLHNCNGLTSISDTIGKVTSLWRLSISKCNKLESLPKAMKNLMSLKTLIILDCALLLPRCQPETGDDWPQIRHIKHIQVK